MKIAIVGSRGIPAAYGGFETFAEKLSSLLSKSGMNVTVVCQSSSSEPVSHGNVKLLYSKYTKEHHPVRFYYDSLRTVLQDAELVLVCGVGGAVFYPFLRKHNAIMVTHTDGREELRGKYSRVKKMYVRIAQLFAAAFSRHLVTDSHALFSFWSAMPFASEHKISVIEFGAEFIDETDDGILGELDLEAGNYFLVVCRMVPENNVEMILRGCHVSGSNKKLLLVGNTSGLYGELLRKMAPPHAVFAEGIYDQKKLSALRKHCLAYIHGHSVGGTNPSLLEAMAAGNVCICHDNKYNRETTGDSMIYFRDEKELSRSVQQAENLKAEEKTAYAHAGRRRISEYYNWERISEKYIRLFKSLMDERVVQD